MTYVIAALAVVVALVDVLLAGVLRSHAEILRALHDLPPGKENDDQGLTGSVLEFFADLAARDRI